MLIQLVNATFRQTDNQAYSPINWTLTTGEHWAIMGPSGSGKSVLLDALAGRITLLGGQLLHPVGPLKTTVELVARDYSFDWRIASAAQFYQQRYNTQTVDAAPTVRDMLQGQVRPTGTIDLASAPVSPPIYTADWLAEIADQLNITYLLDRRLTSLSNGETRRTLLARSLLKRPRVLLLDNPFVGLDADSRAQLHATIDRVGQSGVSLVMVVDERDVPACITNRLVLGEGPGVEGSEQKHGNSFAPSAQHPHSLAPGPIPFATFTHAIQMRNVIIRYGDKTVLHGIDWAVRRGEKWALLGANGSGKSTLLSLVTADNPQAYANDFDLFDRKRGTGESIWSIKAKIGFVSPELHLYFPRQTKVWDVVASGLFDTMGLFRKLTPEQRTRIGGQLQQLGLEELHDKPLSALSVGQQRWVLLARALVKNPPLLVLDEPTQGLDTSQTDHFRALVEQLCMTNPDQTLIYVTHYPGELPNCITHTLRLESGRVV
ncbi:ATP-binding cassette domain-containing protein [uncultured Fibrella sp.]|uniref:ATP-binding cassette domain-containing protein n=1 Tax=uncultured Fibrella sp. TaxID=1284596 RepID=UPI0035CC8759